MSIKFVASTILTAKDNTKGAFAAMARNAKNAEMAVRRVTLAGRDLKDMGKNMSGFVSAPVAALGANALSMATSFEGAMNTVQSKLLITKDAMKDLRDQAKDLGASTSFSATQTGDAMGFLAQAGLNANEILTATPTILNLASAAGLDLAKSADIATNVMGAFQMEMDSAGSNITRVADVLALASAKSNTSVEELAEAMKTAAPVAKGFGMTVEQTSSMLGMLANMGIKGGESGTVFKNMLSNLAAPAGGAEKALDKLNIKQSALFKKTKEGELVFQGVSNMLNVLEKSGASSIDMFKIFGAEAGPGMMAIMKSADGIKDLEKTLQKSGAAAEMAKIKMQGLPGVMAALRSSWEAANIALVESGGFAPIIEGLKAATKGMQAFAKANPDMVAKIVKIGMVVAIAGPALLVLGGALASIGVIAKTAAAGMLLFTPAALPIVAIAAAIGGAAYLIYKNWDKLSVFFKGFGMGLAASFKDIKTAIQPALDAFSSVYNWISKLVAPTDELSSGVAGLASEGYRYGAMMKWIIAPLGAFAGAVVAMKSFSLIASGITMVAGAVKAVGLALMANPIALAVAAIAGGAYLIYKNWDSISTWFSAKWESTKAVFNSFTSWLGSAFLNYTPQGLIYQHWAGIAAWFSEKWASVRAIFDSAIDGLVFALVQFNPVTLLTTAFNKALAYLANLPASFMEMGKNIAAGLGNGIKNAAGNAVDAVKGVGSGMISGLTGMLGIKSPSRVFMGFGENISEGLGIGIARDNSALVAVKDTVNSMTKAAAVQLPAVNMVAPNLPAAAPVLPDLQQVIRFAVDALPTLPSLQSLPPLQQIIETVAGTLPTAPALAGITTLADVQQTINPVLGDSPTVQTLGAEHQLNGSVTADINLRVESENGIKVQGLGTETRKAGTLIRDVGISMERI